MKFYWTCQWNFWWLMTMKETLDSSQWIGWGSGYSGHYAAKIMTLNRIPSCRGFQVTGNVFSNVQNEHSYNINCDTFYRMGLKHLMCAWSNICFSHVEIYRIAWIFRRHGSLFKKKMSMRCPSWFSTHFSILVGRDYF